jgi:DNA-directed RNA polymerase subunit N (RpoN/RPB10)
LAEICKNQEMGKYKSQEEVDKDKMNLVNSIGLERYCCKDRLMTYVKLIEVVK